MEGVTGEPCIPSPRLPSPCDADVPPAPLGERSTRAAGVRGRPGRVAAGRSDVIMSAAVAVDEGDVRVVEGLIDQGCVRVVKRLVGKGDVRTRRRRSKRAGGPGVGYG